ncbi:MAG: hypothetical protein ACK4N5_16580, partial [Myxococcales bacterium]
CDVVVFEAAVAGCAVPETTVTAVGPGTLQLAAVDPSCFPSPTTYSVRVGGAYAVTGTETGLLGRAQPNARFVYQGAYFHRPDNYDPSAPALAFDLGAGDPRRGAR